MEKEEKTEIREEGDEGVGKTNSRQSNVKGKSKLLSAELLL